MEKPIEWAEIHEFPADLPDQLDAYTVDVRAAVAGKPEMTADEMSHAKTLLTSFKEHIESGLEMAIKNGEKAAELKQLLLKWAYS